MNTSAIRKKLYDYIKVAEDKKVKALYTIIENDINEMDSWHKDKKLLAELEKRSSDLKLGVDKGVSWEELKKNLK
jgi:recombinational DNA repair protein RecR